MMILLRTDSSNEDYRKLVSELDKDLAARDGDDAPFFAQYNKSDDIKYCIVAYRDEVPVASGAIKHRGKGIASVVLKDLEAWAKELGYTKCILETGKKMPEELRVYEKND